MAGCAQWVQWNNYGIRSDWCWQDIHSFGQAFHWRRHHCSGRWVALILWYTWWCTKFISMEKFCTKKCPAHSNPRSSMCPGLIPRSAAEIFERADADRDCEYHVSMSYIQIYMEQVPPWFHSPSFNWGGGVSLTFEICVEKEVFFNDVGILEWVVVVDTRSAAPWELQHADSRRWQWSLCVGCRRGTTTRLWYLYCSADMQFQRIRSAWIYIMSRSSTNMIDTWVTTDPSDIGGGCYETFDAWWQESVLRFHEAGTYNFEPESYLYKTIIQSIGIQENNAHVVHGVCRMHIRLEVIPLWFSRWRRRRSTKQPSRRLDWRRGGESLLASWRVKGAAPNLKEFHCSKAITLFWAEPLHRETQDM